MTVAQFTEKWGTRGPSLIIGELLNVAREGRVPTEELINTITELKVDLQHALDDSRGIVR